MTSKVPPLPLSSFLPFQETRLFNAANTDANPPKVVFDQSYRVCGPFYTSNPALSASVQSAIATATSFVASSASSSATAAITGGVQGLSGSSNGSATGTGGMPAPSPFTGSAARLGGANLAVLVSVLAGMVGVVVMIRL